MSYYAEPRIWPGATVAVLASGPSMSASVADQVRRANIPVIVVNNTFRLAPWADMLYACDPEWWAANPDAQDFAGIKLSCSMTPINGVEQLHQTGVTGYDPNPGCIRTGANSGYQAVHVAAHTGATRILLCGFDMHGAHWHGAHPEPLKNTDDATFERWIRRFDLFNSELLQHGVHIINCTPGSALKAFPMVSLAEALEGVPA